VHHKVVKLLYMDDRQDRICSHEAQHITPLIETVSFAMQQRSLILTCKEPVVLALSWGCVSISLQISKADHDPRILQHSTEMSIWPWKSPKHEERSCIHRSTSRILETNEIIAARSYQRDSAQQRIYTYKNRMSSEVCKVMFIRSVNCC
jgi:hypothetical protein